MLLALSALAGPLAHAAGSAIYMYKNPAGSRAYSDPLPRLGPLVKMPNTGRPPASPRDAPIERSPVHRQDVQLPRPFQPADRRPHGDRGHALSGGGRRAAGQRTVR